MIKVFLVEDEYAIREGIKKTIHWEQDGFELVGEAGDGEVAYPKILNTEPDILITDIRMPFMDGLELSKLVKKELPQIKIVILSGYDDFEYAKEAISIGVEEYILKPVSEESLMGELKKIADRISEEKQEEESIAKYMKEREEIRILEKQKFLHDMIDGKISVQDSLTTGKELGIDITASWYNVVLMQMFPKGQEGADDNEYSALKEEIYDKIDVLTGAKDNVFQYDQVGEVRCFLEKADSYEELENNCRTGVNEIEDIMGQYPDMLYYISLGKPVERIRDVNLSYSDASKRFSERYMLEGSRIFSYFEEPEFVVKNKVYTENININNLDISKISQRSTLNFLRNGSLTEIDDFVEDYFDGMGKEAVDSFMLRQYVLLGSYLSSVSFLESMGVGKSDITEQLAELNDTMRFADTVDNSRSYMRKLLSEVIEIRNQLSGKKYTEIIEKARNYIQENYQNEDMSLQSVASNVNVSSNHFSAIFRKETGETFIEYLTTVRMEKAKELLICTSMKTSEVGFEVGYKDPHYFSYIFKKIQGMSPKEYRKSKKES